MRTRLPNSVLQLLITLALAVVASAAWAAWLGWDQQRDVQPDGSTTGPYEAWQVIGLVLTLLAPVYWAASRHHLAGAVLGVPIGLAVTSFIDWSNHDSSGLFVIGVILIVLGSVAATGAVTGVTVAVKQSRRAARPQAG